MGRREEVALLGRHSISKSDKYTNKLQKIGKMDYDKTGCLVRCGNLEFIKGRFKVETRGGYVASRCIQPPTLKVCLFSAASKQAQRVEVNRALESG